MRLQGVSQRGSPNGVQRSCFPVTIEARLQGFRRRGGYVGNTDAQCSSFRCAASSPPSVLCLQAEPVRATCNSVGSSCGQPSPWLSLPLLLFTVHDCVWAAIMVATSPSSYFFRKCFCREQFTPFCLRFCHCESSAIHNVVRPPLWLRLPFF